MTRRDIERIFAAVLASLGWTAVVVQCYWAVELALSKGTTIGLALVNTLSYFTILTNILVASALTATVLGKAPGPLSRLLSPGAKTALASYILIVGCVYEVALRKLWNPEGWRFVVDIILHYIVPIGFAIYWLLFVPKGTLRYSSVWRWTIYPFAYLLYSTFRGSLVGFFPYPFINFHEIGFVQFGLNVLVLVCVFVVTGLLLVFIERVFVRFGGPPMQRAQR